MLSMLVISCFREAFVQLAIEIRRTIRDQSAHLKRHFEMRSTSLKHTLNELHQLENAREVLQVSLAECTTKNGKLNELLTDIKRTRAVEVEEIKKKESMLTENLNKMCDLAKHFSSNNTQLLTDANEKLGRIVEDQSDSVECLHEMTYDLAKLKQEFAGKSSRFSIALNKIDSLGASLEDTSDCLARNSTHVSRQIQQLLNVENKLAVMDQIQEKVELKRQLLYEEKKSNTKLMAMEDFRNIRHLNRRKLYDNMRLGSSIDTECEYIETFARVNSSNDISSFDAQMEWQRKTHKTEEFQKKYENTLFDYNQLQMKYEQLQREHVDMHRRYDESAKVLYVKHEKMNKVIKSLKNSDGN